MKEKETRRTKKKKKGSGLITFCVTLLIVLFAILGILIWQLIRVGNGESLGFGGSSDRKDTAAAVTLVQENETQQTEPVTQAESTSGETQQSSAGTEGTAAVTGQAQPAGQASKMEPQTYANDANGNMIIPAREAGSMEMEPQWEYVLERTGDTVLDEANYLAAMYDYDGAIAKIQSVSGYESNASYTAAISDYEQRKSEAVVYADNSTIPHIFFHTLVVDTGRAFNDAIAVSKQDGMNKVKDYNYVMTTVDEFCRILEEMYARGYVLVSIYDVASYETQADGTQVMKHQPIYLPEGKKPFVLSVDDVSYYEYMEGHGFATKLVVGEDGTPTNEYVMADGTVVYGSYDVVPILDDFVETHPDFSYRGAKGIIALTGYEGVFGYRTSDFWYNSNCTYFGEYFSWNLENNTVKKQSMYYDNPNIEQDKETAKQVAEACKADGWLFASHTWGHNKVGDSGSYERFESDALLWEREVEPLLGEVDIIIYPQGEDLYEGSWRGYDPENAKYQLLKQLGFSYFCSVDSNLGWTQLGSEYFRMGRANVDGQRMWEAISSYVNPESTAKDRLSTLFDSRLVFDWSRPTPVEK